MNHPKKLRDLLYSAIIVIVGNVIYAVGIALFVIPGNLITGGTSGISLFLNRQFSLPVSPTVAVLNISMFLLGWAVLGKKVAATTALSTFVYPVALELVQALLGDYVMTQDKLLCALFGGLCIGVSIGMVVRVGASTGGMEIPPLVLHKLFRVPVSASVYTLDVLILLTQATTRSAEDVLYGLVLVMVYSVMLDKVLTMGKARIQIKVVSEHAQAIRQEILTEVDRGVTMLEGETGFLGYKTQVILCVVSPRELAKTEQLIHRIDPNAFMVVSHTSEVSGRGFSAEKRYLDRVEHQKRHQQELAEKQK